MPASPPAALGRLLLATDPATRAECWTEFVALHSRLLLHVARAGGGHHDRVMDRYAFILEQLQSDDYRRLRSYAADRRSEFSTWLVVVAQRLCLDHQRSRYGRFRGRGEDSPGPSEDRAARRRLVDLIGAEVDLGTLADASGRDPETKLRQRDLDQALEAALARLHPRDRLLLKLRFEDGLSMPEVAAHLGFRTRFHVHRRLKTVLATLRRLLEDRGIGESTP
ncbi:MAG TPA: sigma-70 family RNA polymerase sigma factor [Gemmatimonadales bacterium]|jgi:RNA polymerase sigma factor (sigma-70 family)